MSRTNVAIGVLAAFTGAILAAGFLPSEGHGQTPPKVRIGWNYHMGNAPAFVMDYKGLLKKHGVDAEVRSFASGPSVSQALAAGQIDVAYVGFLPTSRAVERDTHATIVTRGSYGLGSILVRKDSGI
jgi:NitT/TauT family transport system substrate-binding protein